MQTLAKITFFVISVLSFAGYFVAAMNPDVLLLVLDLMGIGRARYAEDIGLALFFASGPVLFLHLLVFLFLWRNRASADLVRETAIVPNYRMKRWAILFPGALIVGSLSIIGFHWFAATLIDLAYGETMILFLYPIAVLPFALGLVCCERVGQFGISSAYLKYGIYSMFCFAYLVPIIFALTLGGWAAWIFCSPPLTLICALLWLFGRIKILMATE